MNKCEHCNAKQNPQQEMACRLMDAGWICERCLKSNPPPPKVEGQSRAFNE